MSAFDPPRFALRLALALTVLAAGACTRLAGGGEAPHVVHYQLGVAPQLAPITLNTPLMLGDVKGIDPFDDTRLAYQTSTYRLNLYSYHRWISPPTDLVHSSLSRYMSTLGQPNNGAGGLPLTLNVRILAFQEVDQGDSRSGLVEIEFCLLSADTTKPPLWCFISQHDNPAGDTPDSAVAAINTGLNQAIADLNSHLRAQLSGASYGLSTSIAH